MKITKGKLKEIIAEEVAVIREKKDGLETLIESYAASYETDTDNVSKEAIIDFLEALDEKKIPKIALEAFMRYLPEDSVSSLLKEVVEE